MTRAGPRALLLNQARELAAGDRRRARRGGRRRRPALARRLRAPRGRLRRRRSALERFAALPQIVAVIEQDERRAVGVTVEGVPVEVVAADPSASAPRCCAPPALPPTSPRSSRCPMRRTSRPSTAARHPVLPARAARGAVPRRAARARRGSPTSAATCTATRRGRTGARASRRWAAPPATAATSTSRSATTRRRSAPSGPQPDDVRRQAEEIAAANEVLAPFRVLRGIECDILPDGRLDLPDDVLAELDWVQASVHGGQRMPRREMTKRVEEALRNPYVAASATRRAGSSPAAPRTRSTSTASSRWRSRHGVAMEVNGLPPRLDLSGEHVREALARRRADRLLDRRPLHSASGTWRSPSTPHGAAGRPRPTSSTPGRGQRPH